LLVQQHRVICLETRAQGAETEEATLSPRNTHEEGDVDTQERQHAPDELQRDRRILGAAVAYEGTR